MATNTYYTSLVATSIIRYKFVGIFVANWEDTVLHILKDMVNEANAAGKILTHEEAQKFAMEDELIMQFIGQYKNY